MADPLIQRYLQEADIADGLLAEVAAGAPPDMLIAMAQVHATLALAAAVREIGANGLEVLRPVIRKADAAVNAHPCRCCGGTGRLNPNTRPLCATAIQRRDTRSPDQLDRLGDTFLQRIALQGIAYDDDGELLPEHGRPYIDYATGQVIG